MSSFHEFITMGGYAVYVWPSYGLAAIVLIANLWLPRRKHQKVLAELRRRSRRGEES